MAPYDIIGNIAIVKFHRGTKYSEKKKFALSLLKKNKQITTVLEKINKFSGRLRKQKTKFIAGIKTKEALYKENGCEFRLNVDSCYFSPRLSTERSELAYLTRKDECVLVMFGGVGSFAIVLAKNSNAKKIVSVEISKNCNKYAYENVKRNKVVDKVTIIQGDVKRIIGKGKKISEKFDRIIMARPNLKDSFLDIAFSVIAKKGIIHYYGFYYQHEVDKMKKLIETEAKKARKKIKIVRIKKAGDIGVRKFRYRADIFVN